MTDRYKAVVSNVQATAHMAAHPNGDYVRLADYEALRAEVEMLRDQQRMNAETIAANARLAAEVERLRAQALQCGCHHLGYIIGMHWMAAAYSRVCAGDPEAEVMADFGYARTSPSPGVVK